MDGTLDETYGEIGENWSGFRVHFGGEELIGFAGGLDIYLPHLKKFPIIILNMNMPLLI